MRAHTVNISLGETHLRSHSLQLLNCLPHLLKYCVKNYTILVAEIIWLQSIYLNHKMCELFRNGLLIAVALQIESTLYQSSNNAHIYKMVP